mmetsp:Transcript_60977/g.142659  ORF Transcript_60977/g.142659 Transcript_60977/m.142659 type:complete len:588 (-) Transcript_60977:206-1969(-)
MRECDGMPAPTAEAPATDDGDSVAATNSNQSDSDHDEFDNKVDRTASMSSSLQSLPTVLEEDLVQGVPLRVCFSGWGRHWSPTARSGPKLSRRTHFFDNFLSHDWRTPRWLKYISMLVIFNSRAAAIASFITSLAIGLLRAFGVVPDSAWTVVFGYAVFYVFLFFWQQMREVLLRPKIVFLDKLCIDQDDVQLKDKGIKGLAGFLDRTKKLTILWSPYYFSRLWCTYELATFLRNPGARRPMEVISVRMCYLLFLMSVCWRVLLAVYYLLISSSDLLGEDTAMLVRRFLPILITVILPMHYYKGLGLMQSIRELPTQLQGFRIQNAECFCCKHNHIHPHTQEEMGCDRELIFNTLKAWYGTSTTQTDEDHLRQFNNLVQKKLSPSVLEAASGETLPLHYALYMVVSANLPWLTEYVASMATPPALEGLDLLVWGLRGLADWAYVCFLMLVAMRCSIALWGRGVPMLARLPRIAVTFLLIPLIVLVMLAVWVPFQLCLTLTDEASPAPFLPFVLALLFIVYLFRSQTFLKPRNNGSVSEGPGPAGGEDMKVAQVKSNSTVDTRGDGKDHTNHDIMNEGMTDDAKSINV